MAGYIKRTYHYSKLSKLYVSVACNPDCVSLAPFIVSVTLFFVHVVGFPVTLVIVGAICKQILSKKHIKIASHIKKLYNILDKDVESFSELEKMNNEYFPVLSNDKKEEMLELLEKVRLDNDSVGGILETYVEGIEGGIGEPFFDSIESMISSLVFSVPAVKGVSFGKGFGFAELLGSSANDPFTYENNKNHFHKTY